MPLCETACEILKFFRETHRKPGARMTMATLDAHCGTDPAVAAIALEELYSIEWWAEADSKGWLEGRNRSAALSEVASTRILNQETNWDELVDGAAWSLKVEKCVAEGRKAIGLIG